MWNYLLVSTLVLVSTTTVVVVAWMVDAGGAPAGDQGRLVKIIGVLLLAYVIGLVSAGFILTRSC